MTARASSDELRDALRRLAMASRDYTVARYRYVHGTGVEKVTDEVMDVATKALMDETGAALQLLEARTEAP